MERLILFDDECIFCNRSIQFIYRRDKRKIEKRERKESERQRLKEGSEIH